MERIEGEELKKLQIDILDFFVKVCNKNGLTYFLGGGTLLGALRHKGFIPWDDDIDVMMPRDDYDKLFDAMPNNVSYALRDSRNTQNYPFPYATLNDTRTYKKELKLRSKYTQNLCVNIDIFPIDNVPDSEESINVLYQQISHIGAKLQCVSYKFGLGKGLFKTIRKNLAILSFRLLELFGITSLQKVIKQFISIGTQYNKSETKKCGVTLIAHYGAKEVNIKADYLPAVNVEFEGKTYSAPKCYDVYLSKLYGDYMTLPPKSMQKTHHTSDSFWK